MMMPLPVITTPHLSLFPAGPLLTSMSASSANMGTFADGPLASAAFYTPAGIASSAADGSIFVADSGSNRIRRINSTAQSVASVVGPGLGQSIVPSAPTGVAVDPVTGDVYFSDTGANCIRVWRNASGEIQTVRLWAKQ